METVNVNKSTAKDLQKIIGIGAKRAAKIIGNRPFRDIYELSKVAGLGKKRMEKIIQQDILIEI
jgi:competence ComEA-like helix-hairpin-helix protein